TYNLPVASNAIFWSPGPPNPGAGSGIWKTFLQVAPPSSDFQTGAILFGPQFSENETTAIFVGSIGFTAMLGSVSARLNGSLASFAISTKVAAEAPPEDAKMNAAARNRARLDLGLCFAEKESPLIVPSST